MSKVSKTQHQASSETKNVRKQVAENADRLKKIHESVEKTRKYFLVTMIFSIVVFILPLIAAAFIVPMFLDSYLGQLQGLGL